MNQDNAAGDSTAVGTNTKTGSGSGSEGVKEACAEVSVAKHTWRGSGGKGGRDSESITTLGAGDQGFKVIFSGGEDGLSKIVELALSGKMSLEELRYAYDISVSPAIYAKRKVPGEYVLGAVTDPIPPVAGVEVKLEPNSLLGGERACSLIADIFPSKGTHLGVNEEDYKAQFVVEAEGRERPQRIKLKPLQQQPIPYRTSLVVMADPASAKGGLAVLCSSVLSHQPNQPPSSTEVEYTTRVIETFRRALEMTVNGAYKSAGVQCPPQQLVLSAPASGGGQR